MHLIVGELASATAAYEHGSVTSGELLQRLYQIYLNWPPERESILQWLREHPNGLKPTPLFAFSRVSTRGIRLKVW
jgi:hypothetical protein